MPTPKIDMHCHLLPPGLIAALRARDDAPCIESNGAGAEQIRIFRTAMPFDAADNDPDKRVGFMDRHRIDLHVISLPGLFGIDSLPADEATRLTDLFNTGMAEIVRGHPDRFRAIAALPLADKTAAAASLRRARSRLGMVGAILPADGFRSLAAAEDWRPILAEAVESGAHLFIHPGPLPEAMAGRSVDAPALHSDTVEHRRVTVDAQNGLTDAMVTVSLTDLLDHYPGVSVQVANLGGTLPFVLERMDHIDQIRHPDLPPASARLRRVYVDTASFGPRAVRATVEALGADRVLFGTDHPIFETRFCLDGLAPLPPRLAEAVGGGNAARLLGIE